MTNRQWYSRYSRHFLLDNFDEHHQQQLHNATITIIGMGGLGSTAAQHLAAMGVGTLNLVDEDTVSVSNLPRQLLYTQAQIGRPKVLAAKDQLLANNPDCTIHTFLQRARADDMDDLGGTANALLDCTDSVTSRLELSRFARRAALPLFSGAASGYTGQAIAFTFGANAPCYGCLHSLGAHAPPNCLNHGILGPVVSAIALYQVMLVVYFLTGIAPVPWGTLHCFNASGLSWQTLQLTVNPQCRICQL